MRVKNDMSDVIDGVESNGEMFSRIQIKVNRNRQSIIDIGFSK